MDQNWMKLAPGEEYFYHVERGSVEIIQCSLHRAVDPEKLRAAVERTMRAFPRLTLRPYLDENAALVMRPNDAPVAVYPMDSPAAELGSEDSNGYMFRVMYADDSIRVSMHHSLGDGRTAFGVLYTVVFYYLQACGVLIDPQGLLYTEETADDPSLFDSLIELLRGKKLDPPTDEYIPTDVFAPKSKYSPTR